MRKTSKEQYDKPCANVQNIWTGYPGPTAGTERFNLRRDETSRDFLKSRLVSSRAEHYKRGRRWWCQLSLRTKACPRSSGTSG
jgi:hypothetical protein